MLFATCFRALNRRSETDNVRKVLRSAAPAAFLTAAKLHPLNRGSLPHVEQPDSFWSRELVCGKRQEVDAQLLNIDGSCPGRLHGVRVHQHAMLARDSRNLFHWLNGANFIVRQHDRYERRFPSNCRFNGCGINESLRIDWHNGQLKSLALK